MTEGECLQGGGVGGDAALPWRRRDDRGAESHNAPASYQLAV